MPGIVQEFFARHARVARTLAVALALAGPALPGAALAEGDGHQPAGGAYMTSYGAPPAGFAGLGRPGNPGLDGQEVRATGALPAHRAAHQRSARPHLR